MVMPTFKGPLRRQRVSRREYKRGACDGDHYDILIALYVGCAVQSGLWKNELAKVNELAIQEFDDVPAHEIVMEGIKGRTH